MSEDGGGSDPAATDEELRQELSRVQRRVRGMQDDLRRTQAELADTRTEVAISVVAVGLLVLLATTWLAASSESQAVGSGGARTGLGLIAGPWRSEETLAQWVGVVSVFVYLGAAVTALASAAGAWTPTVAAGVGLTATLALLLAKPRGGGYAEWEFSWQSPPLLACAFWIVLIALGGSRVPRRR